MSPAWLTHTCSIQRNLPLSLSFVTKFQEYSFSLQLIAYQQMAQSIKNLTAMPETQVQSLVWDWRREQQLTPTFLPGEFHGQRSLAAYNSWIHKELDMTEQLTFSQLIEVHIYNVSLHWWYLQREVFTFLFLLQFLQNVQSFHDGHFSPAAHFLTHLDFSLTYAMVAKWFSISEYLDGNGVWQSVFL